MRRVFLLLCLVPLIYACGQSGQASFIELRYRLTGGVAGFDRSLVISDKGAFQVDEPGLKPRYGQMAGQRFHLLMDKVGQIDWANLEHRYADERVADALFEELTVRTPSGRYDVIIATGGKAPAELEELTGLLRQLAIEAPG